MTNADGGSDAQYDAILAAQDLLGRQDLGPDGHVWRSLATEPLAGFIIAAAPEDRGTSWLMRVFDPVQRAFLPDTHVWEETTRELERNGYHRFSRALGEIKCLDRRQRDMIVLALEMSVEDLARIHKPDHQP